MQRGLIISYLLWALGSANATVRLVPDEYPLIQSALNASQDSDTILVRPGIYAEALIAPPHSFYLLGDSSPDSVDRIGPVIDPAILPGSDTLACLTIPEGATPIISQVKFRNGAAMYPRPTFGTFWGGLKYRSSTAITIVNCVFDSTYYGIIYTDRDVRPHITVAQTVFRNIQGGCIAARSPLHVDQCRMEGHNIGGMGSIDSTLIENSTFTGEIDLGWVGVYRTNHIVRNCTFGPGVFHQTALDIWSWGNVLIENNVFRDLQVGGTALRADLKEGEPLIVRNNLFENLTLNEFQSGQAISVLANDGEPFATLARFENCVVRSCSLGQPGLPTPKAVTIGYIPIPCEFLQNRFSDLHPDDGPAFNVDTLGSIHTLADNIFTSTAYAVRNQFEQLDATYNYWGDSTGPYHSTLNPEGLGDEIRGDVLFEPWYPDSNFLATSEPPRFTPINLALEAFPNPFNNTVRIRFTPADLHDTYAVMIFNEQGQRVANIWSGIATGTQELTWNAANFPSGIYFVRAISKQNRFSTVAKIALIK